MPAPQYLHCQKLIDELRGGPFCEEKAVTLVIGDMEKWIAEGRPMPPSNDLTYLDYHDLSSEQVSTVEPEIILSPLVAKAFDAYQVVKDLKTIGYQGRYRAVARELPNIAMVRDEISAIAPEIDFDIVVVNPKLVVVS